MERQLLLLEPEPDWHIDERTREVGRAGIADARAALRSALVRADGRVGGSTGDRTGDPAGRRAA